MVYLWAVTSCVHRQFCPPLPDPPSHTLLGIKVAPLIFTADSEVCRKCLTVISPHIHYQLVPSSSCGKVTFSESCTLRNAETAASLSHRKLLHFALLEKCCCHLDCLPIMSFLLTCKMIYYRSKCLCQSVSITAANEAGNQQFCKCVTALSKTWNVVGMYPFSWTLHILLREARQQLLPAFIKPKNTSSGIFNILRQFLFVNGCCNSNVFFKKGV